MCIQGTVSGNQRNCINSAAVVADELVNVPLFNLDNGIYR